LRHREAGNFEYLLLMQGARATTVEGGIAGGSWSEIFRNGLGLYSALVIGGIAMNATQMLVIAIIMPTIVRDIGGANFYTWAAMLYTIGAIVGGASTGTVWSRLGARRAYTLGAECSRLARCAVRWRRTSAPSLLREGCRAGPGGSSPAAVWR
jgi:hypothetical protein